MTNTHLDEGDSEVVRGGVEPLDGGDHTGVVHQAQELRLVRGVVQQSNISVLNDRPICISYD